MVTWTKKTCARAEIVKWLEKCLLGWGQPKKRRYSKVLYSDFFGENFCGFFDKKVGSFFNSHFKFDYVFFFVRENLSNFLYHKIKLHWGMRATLDEGPRPKSGKLRLNPHGTILEGKSIASEPKKKSSKESSWFGEPRCKLQSKAGSNSRIQFASNESKLVPRNLDPEPRSKVSPTQRQYKLTISNSLFNNHTWLACHRSIFGAHTLVYFQSILVQWFSTCGSNTKLRCPDIRRTICTNSFRCNRNTAYKRLWNFE